MGAGRLVRWERPIQFALAWFTSHLALKPLVISPYDEEGVDWFFIALSPWVVLEELVASLVLAVLALVVLKLIGQVFLAVPVLALLYPLLSWPIFATRIRLQIGDYLDESNVERFGAWFDLTFFISEMVWILLFFLSLALGLKLMSSRWLGLFLGAMGGAILAGLGRYYAATMFDESVTWDRGIIWLGQGLVEGTLFALLLILALAIAAPRDKEPRKNVLNIESRESTDLLNRKAITLLGAAGWPFILVGLLVLGLTIVVTMTALDEPVPWAAPVILAAIGSAFLYMGLRCLRCRVSPTGTGEQKLALAAGSVSGFFLILIGTPAFFALAFAIGLGAEGMAPSSTIRFLSLLGVYLAGTTLLYLVAFVNFVKKKFVTGAGFLIAAGILNFPIGLVAMAFGFAVKNAVKSTNTSST